MHFPDKDHFREIFCLVIIELKWNTIEQENEIGSTVDSVTNIVIKFIVFA